MQGIVRIGTRLLIAAIRIIIAVIVLVAELALYLGTFQSFSKHIDAFSRFLEKVGDIIGGILE